MNRFEQRAVQQRRAALRSSMTLWTAALSLVVVILLIMGLRGSAPSSFFSKVTIGVAILLLVLRQVSRRLRAKGTPRAAQPDPKSTLKLS